MNTEEIKENPSTKIVNLPKIKKKQVQHAKKYLAELSRADYRNMGINKEIQQANIYRVENPYAIHNPYYPCPFCD